MSKTDLPATLSGMVTPFKGNGRKLGYPTANFVTPTELADGVYFGFSDLSNYRHHPSIIFIGIPTTMGNTQRRIETYLLDIPDKDYYQLPVTIVLEYFHRTNQTFDSVNALMAAMKTDEATMRKWLSTL